MKIRCKECKTVYDNSEKYCPFCFERTNATSRSRVRIDGENGQRTSKNYRKIMDISDTKCCEERKTKRYAVNQPRKTNHKDNKNKSNSQFIRIVILMVIIEILAFFF